MVELCWVHHLIFFCIGIRDRIQNTRIMCPDIIALILMFKIIIKISSTNFLNKTESIWVLINKKNRIFFKFKNNHFLAILKMPSFYAHNAFYSNKMTTIQLNFYFFPISPGSKIQQKCIRIFFCWIYRILWDTQQSIIMKGWVDSMGSQNHAIYLFAWLIFKSQRTKAQNLPSIGTVKKNWHYFLSHEKQKRRSP